MPNELTFSDIKKQKIAEFQRLIALLSDDNKQLDLEKREKQLLLDLEQVRQEIADYRTAIGLPPRSPAGTLMAPPIAANVAPKKAPGAPRGPRVNKDEMRSQLMEALKVAGPQGLTVSDLAEKSGYEYQTVNNFRKNDTDLMSRIETAKSGVAVYVSLKPVQPQDSRPILNRKTLSPSAR